MNKSELEDAALAMVERRGRAVMDKVKQKILGTVYDNGVIDSALQHYVTDNLPLVFPLFPALMSISYEVASGNSGGDDFDSVAVAMMFIAFSADIHDDVIDKSDVKYDKETVYGKFGSEVAVLVGDVLLIEGYSLLYKACESFSLKQRGAIFVAVSKALFELCAVEALEVKLRKEVVVEPEVYFEVMRLKGVFAGLQCRVGGILGHADDELLEVLTGFGRVVGMFGAIGDEFNDLFDVSELVHRVKFEYPPLPMIYAFQDEVLRNTVSVFVEQLEGSKGVVKKVAKLVLNSEGVYELRCKIREYFDREVKNVVLYKKNGAGLDAFLLLQVLSFVM
ncbi:MAG: polyprenyl synthetase family protein [Candidatus Bathyarchaeota archaeon]|nr:polyprenyl synthetase family protein [Candidatus Termiticorpusculum sp.]